MVLGFKKVFVSYLNDDDKKVEGYVDLIEENQAYIKIKTNYSTILIPMHRLLKMKETSNGN